jgi:hypothetical protein
MVRILVQLPTAGFSRRMAWLPDYDAFMVLVLLVQSFAQGIKCLVAGLEYLIRKESMDDASPQDDKHSASCLGDTKGLELRDGIRSPTPKG